VLDIQKNSGQAQQLEAYHDAWSAAKCANMFTLGLMELPEKAKIEPLYWEIKPGRVQSFPGSGLRAGRNSQAGGQPGRSVPVQFLRVPIAAGPLGVGQLFPIMPVSRLNERPNS